MTGLWTGGLESGLPFGLWARLWNGILTPNSASMHRDVSIEWISANVLQTAWVHWWEPVLFHKKNHWSIPSTIRDSVLEDSPVSLFQWNYFLSTALRNEALILSLCCFPRTSLFSNFQICITSWISLLRRPPERLWINTHWTKLKFLFKFSIILLIWIIFPPFKVNWYFYSALHNGASFTSNSQLSTVMEPYQSNGLLEIRYLQELAKRGLSFLVIDSYPLGD